ncbi:hypothetical protein L198_04063, partial [Cryptococcus wingfieldii CBS 7118]
MSNRKSILDFPPYHSPITPHLLFNADIPLFLAQCLSQDCPQMLGVRVLAEREKHNIAAYRRLLARLLILVDWCDAEQSIGQSGLINHQVNFRYASRIWSEIPDDGDMAAMWPNYLADPPTPFRRRYFSPDSSPRRSASPRRHSSHRRPAPRRRSYSLSSSSSGSQSEGSSRRHSFHASPLPRTPSPPPPSPTPSPPTPPLPPTTAHVIITKVTIHLSKRDKIYLNFHYTHKGLASIARWDSPPAH